MTARQALASAAAYQLLTMTAAAVVLVTVAEALNWCVIMREAKREGL